MTNHAQGLDRGLTNYGDRDFASYLRRSMARSMGVSNELLGKPIVGIAVSPSQFNNCHRYMPELAEAVARGVLAAGGLPREFPTISLGEVFLNPTSMVFRNLMSMDVEEMIRAQPMDAVVLIGGCDKTVPAQLMGAASAGRPAIQLVTGPMMTGRHKGERLGACTDCRRFWGKFRAGEIDAIEIKQVEGRLATTAGTCAVMGTAQVPVVTARRLSTCAISIVSTSPARYLPQKRRQSVHAPSRSPLWRPVIIGPVTSWIAGLFADTAPISCAGTVLSQPPISTTASIGCARIISSTSIAIRLRNIMLVGFRNTSPNDTVGNARGSPPAASTPRSTACVSSGIARWQLLKPLGDTAMPTTGLLNNSFDSPIECAIERRR